MLKVMVAVACAVSVPAGTVQAATLTLTPTDDAWVSNRTPNMTRGADPVLHIGGMGSANDHRAYLRFSGAVPPGAVVTRTTLRLYFGAPSSTRYDLRLAKTSNWNEGEITFNNAPAVTGPVSGETNSIHAGWNAIPAPLLPSGRPITYVLTRAGPEAAAMQSKENVNRPQLVVEYADPVTTPTSVCSPAGCLESRPGVTTMSWDVVVADFNSDGRDDYMVGHHSGIEDQIQLQRPDGTFEPDLAHFPDAGQPGHFPPGDRHGCAAGDVNADGRVDLYCMLGGDGGEGIKGNELWITQPDGTFSNQASVWGVDDPFGRGRRPVLFDFDHIGAGDDLYVTNLGPRADGKRSDDILYLNNRSPLTGPMVEKPVSASDAPDRERVGYRCVANGDWNRDSYTDLVVCGSRLRLFENGADPRGGRLTAQSDSLLGAQIDHPEDAQLSDVNGDGWDDLVVVTKRQLQIRLNRGPGNPGQRFPVTFTAQLTDGKSVSIGDLTGDGLPDVYVVEGAESGPDGTRNAPDKLFASPKWARVAIPQAANGTGDDSQFINIQGRRTLIVTNGRNRARGEIQFISFRPSTSAPPSIPPSGQPLPPQASPSPPPAVDTAKVPALPKAARVIRLRSMRRCVTRRRMRIRIRRVDGMTVASASVFVNGKRTKTSTRSDSGASIRVARLPRGRFRLKVVVITGDGRKLRRSASYRSCSRKRGSRRRRASRHKA